MYNSLLGKALNIPMNAFYYVYFLSDCATGTHHYVGYTSLKPAERLAVHNSGSVSHTSKFRPWRITAAIAVDSEVNAIELEKYFKTHSGRAFANKHLFPQEVASS